METCCSRKNKYDARATEPASSHSCRPARCSSEIRTHDGWKFKWTEPTNFVSAVIRGPFLHPRLVKALPYVVISSCDECGYKSDATCKLRNGIPDPWQEYLSWKDSGVPGAEETNLNDVGLSRDCLRYTDYAWNRKGLAMVQGIPDPWKIDMFCKCEKTERQNFRRQKRKKSKVNEIIRGEMKEMADEVRNSINADKTNDDLEKVSRKSMKKLEDPNELNSIKQQLTENLRDYEKIKQQLREVDDELKLNQAENEKRKQDAKKREKKQRKLQRTNKKSKLSSNYPEIICCTSHLLHHPSAFVTVKPSAKEKSIKGPIRDYVDRRIRTGISAYVHEEFEKQLREAGKSRTRGRRHSGSPDRSSVSCSPCGGSCGRLFRRDDNTANKVTTTRRTRNTCGCSDDDNASEVKTEDLRAFLKEINSRIEITKDAMKSPNLGAIRGEGSRKEEKKKKKDKGSKDSSKKSSSGKRESGAGDKVDSRCESDLFVRRKYLEHGESREDESQSSNDEKVSRTASYCEVLQIPGTSAASEPKRSTWNINNGVENDEEIIVQSFTETE